MNRALAPEIIIWRATILESALHPRVFCTPVLRLLTRLPSPFVMRESVWATICLRLSNSPGYRRGRPNSC
jgi:hypothetical protein